jgi:hypothetical protein
MSAQSTQATQEHSDRRRIHQRSQSSSARQDEEQQQVFPNGPEAETEMRDAVRLKFRPHGGMASAFAFGEWAGSEALRIVCQRFWS